MTIADDMAYIDRHRDDPCDDWSAMFFIQWVPVNMHDRRTHKIRGVIDPDAFGTIEPPPIHLGRFNCRGDYVVPQHVMCNAGHHHWTEWGNFIPAYPHLLTGVFTVEQMPSPSYEPIEAYRWRYCECGVAQRETFDGGARKIFTKDEQR